MDKYFGNFHVLKNIDLQVDKGDRVIFSSYAGTEIKHGGHDYLIVREDEILAIVG